MAMTRAERKKQRMAMNRALVKHAIDVKFFAVKDTTIDGRSYGDGVMMVGPIHPLVIDSEAFDD